MSSKKHKCLGCGAHYKTRGKSQKCCETKGFEFTGFVTPQDQNQDVEMVIVYPGHPPKPL